uniref:DDE-1 domain-containing protein n=1 Tax=Amphimedon queenslandica TaxID=400682 RepID=A0A1X7TX50_AMPQE
MEEIPHELVINWDHMGINYIPVSNLTMAEGVHRVKIVGLGNKRQLTVVFACSLNGDFLPPQVIYAGKTPRCLPSVSFPKSWHVTFTENHWANERTTIDNIRKNLLPYVQETHQKLSLSPDHAALVIYDRFKGQCTHTVLQLLSDNSIQIAIVPANLTDRLQPLDISVNKAVKDCLHKQFSE